eukprot:1745797-Lingulodinium_polyedra.AAC.1
MARRGQPPEVLLPDGLPDEVFAQVATADELQQKRTMAKCRLSRIGQNVCLCLGQKCCPKRMPACPMWSWAK